MDEPRHVLTARWHLERTPIPNRSLRSYSPPLEALNAVPAIGVPKNIESTVLFFDSHLFRMRLVTAVFFLLLGLLVWRWSASLYGESAGIFSLLLYAFCPTLLGHGAWVTTDTPFSFAAVLWFWSFWRLWRDRSSWNLLVCSVAFGIGLLSKFNFLVFIPAYFLCGLLTIQWKTGTKTNESIARYFKDSIVIFGVGWILLMAAYRWELAQWHGIILPLPKDYIADLRCVYEQALHGDPRFLMGRYSTVGWPYYYFVAFALKTPIPTLLFLALALFLTVKTQWRSKTRDEYFLWVPTLVLFIVASLQHCQIGIRHILPVYPFLFILSGIVWKTVRSWNYYWHAGGVLLMIWLIVSSVRIFPDYIAYFNELIGGPKNGYLYLIDSNIDWGQDIPSLKKYMLDHNLRTIKADIFCSPRVLKKYAISTQEIPKGPSSGIIVVSVHKLMVGHGDDQDRYAWLRKHKPIARIGHSILIYDIQENAS